jgi:hypothetical protein
LAPRAEPGTVIEIILVDKLNLTVLKAKELGLDSGQFNNLPFFSSHAAKKPEPAKCSCTFPQPFKFVSHVRWRYKNEMPPLPDRHPGDNVFNNASKSF